MYHDITIAPEKRPHPYFKTNTTPQAFREQMKFLHDQGYRTLTMDQAVTRLFTGNAYLAKCAVITFDDGFQSCYRDAFPILAEFGFTATVFPVAGFVQRTGSDKFLSWSELRELHSYGFQVGSHTMTHPRLVDLRPRQVEEEVGLSKDLIEERVGVPVRSFSYPFAFPETDKMFTRLLLDTLRKYGYDNGTSTIVGTAGPCDQRFFLPRLPVNSADDRGLFHAKLECGYDWLHAAQILYKYLKYKRGLPGARVTAMPPR